MARENIDIVLDYERNIKVNPTIFPFRNMHALDYLPSGIYQLANAVRYEEIKLNQEQPIPGSNLFAPGPMGVRYASYFLWFCSSLTNYLRLVGFVELASKHGWSSRDVPANMQKVKKHCDAYILEVVPDIVQWRKKVAAHSALTDPRKEDSPALLEYSVFDFVSYHHPYLTAGAFQLHDVNESLDGISGSSDMALWAVTEVFERLNHRFWPDTEIQPFPTSDT